MGSKGKALLSSSSSSSLLSKMEAPARVTATVDLRPRGASPVVDGVHLLPCSVKYNGACAVSDYFKPRNTDVELEGMRVQEAFFRGRKLHGVTVPIPDDYCGYVLEKKIGGENNSGSESKLWESSGQFGKMTYWNHDDMPCIEDPLLRSLHWFPVSHALHKRVTEEEMEKAKADLEQ
ncbi:hypothetical protein LUZ60_017318 [Juncus effusus]|nr:hypothetical protein LUZ60_017318 [Juncus effusus]